MIIFTFESLEAEIKKQGSDLVFIDSIKLKMTELPNGIQSITVKDGGLDGDKLTKLPDSITIKVAGSISLDNLTTIDNNITIEAGMNIYLNGLAIIGSSVTIEAGWAIKLKKLTIIGNNVIIESDMDICLNSLTTIGNNVTINAKWGITFNNTYTDIKILTLTDNNHIPTKIVQFLIDKKITVKCPKSSPLVNLAFEGVKVEIMY